MKKIILSLLVVAPALSIAQTSLVKPDSLYIVTYTLGPTWDMSKPPQDQPFFKEHSANLAKLRKDGIIRLGGRFGEKGMIVIAVKDGATARELIYSDQSVVNKLFNADLQKFNMFYDGCLEKLK